MSVSASQASFPLPFVVNQEPVVVDHPGELEKKEDSQNGTNHPTAEFNPHLQAFMILTIFTASHRTRKPCFQHIP